MLFIGGKRNTGWQTGLYNFSFDVLGMGWGKRILGVNGCSRFTPLWSNSRLSKINKLRGSGPTKGFCTVDQVQANGSLKSFAQLQTDFRLPHTCSLATYLAQCLMWLFQLWKWYVRQIVLKGWSQVFIGISLTSTYTNSPCPSWISGYLTLGISPKSSGIIFLVLLRDYPYVRPDVFLNFWSTGHINPHLCCSK